MYGTCLLLGQRRRSFPYMSETHSNGFPLNFLYFCSLRPLVRSSSLHIQIDSRTILERRRGPTPKSEIATQQPVIYSTNDRLWAEWSVCKGTGNERNQNKLQIKCWIAFSQRILTQTNTTSFKLRRKQCNGSDCHSIEDWSISIRNANGNDHVTSRRRLWILFKEMCRLDCIRCPFIAPNLMYTSTACWIDMYLYLISPWGDRSLSV